MSSKFSHRVDHRTPSRRPQHPLQTRLLGTRTPRARNRRSEGRGKEQGLWARVPPAGTHEPGTPRREAPQGWEMRSSPRDLRTHPTLVLGPPRGPLMGHVTSLNSLLTTRPPGDRDHWPCPRRAARRARRQTGGARGWGRRAGVAANGGRVSFGAVESVGTT